MSLVAFWDSINKRIWRWWWWTVDWWPCSLV